MLLDSGDVAVCGAGPAPPRASPACLLRSHAPPYAEAKGAWIPACAGMTGVMRRNEGVMRVVLTLALSHRGCGW